VKDRLKELDPPPVQNYIDAQTYDNIMAKRRKQGVLRPKSGNRQQKDNSEH
jgi:hypothetical protein